MDSELFSPTLKKKNNRKLNKKPRVVFEWSNDNVFKLIACVQELPALWDARDAKYRNKIERGKLWDEMAENDFQSKFPGEELLPKWTNIRIQFRSYANKKKSGGAAAHPINWNFFSAMEFIGKTECQQTSATESNLSEDDQNITTASVDNISKQDISSTPRRPRKRPSAETTVSNASSNSSAALIIAESLKSAAEALTLSKQQTCDASDTFGKYLASELRSLDNIAMARRLKHKLNRIFLDALAEEQETSHEIVIYEEEDKA